MRRYVTVCASSDCGANDHEDDTVASDRGGSVDAEPRVDSVGGDDAWAHADVGHEAPRRLLTSPGTGVLTFGPYALDPSSLLFCVSSPVGCRDL